MDTNAEVYAKQLQEKYPQSVVVFQTRESSGSTCLSIQPHVDVELKLEVSLPQSSSRCRPVLNNILGSFSKRDMQSLQRSLDICSSVEVEGCDVYLGKVFSVIYDFINSHGLCDKSKTAGNKSKRKKVRTNGTGSHSTHNEEDNKSNDGEPVTQNAVREKMSKRQKRRMRLDDDDDDDILDNTDGVMSHLHEPYVSVADPNISALSITVRPTHFLAVRVTESSIIKQLVDVQRQLVEKEPLLEKGAFSPYIFHLTLLTLGLDSDEDIQNCVQALDILKPFIEKERPQSPLVVRGVSQFYNRAVFANVTFGDDVTKFRECIRNKLESLNVEVRDQYEKFNPHVTIVKVKRPERKLFGSRNIQPAIYSHVKDSLFGEQYVNDLHLCTMDGQRRYDGFYRTLYSLEFKVYPQ